MIYTLFCGFFYLHFCIILYCHSSATSCTVSCVDVPGDAPDVTYCATKTSYTSEDEVMEKHKSLKAKDMDHTNFETPDLDELAHHEKLTRHNRQVQEDKLSFMTNKPKKELRF